MPPIGIPHPGPVVAVFTGLLALQLQSWGAEVGQPGFLGGQIGIAHNFPDTTEPGIYTGTDPKADVGRPLGVA